VLRATVAVQFDQVDPQVFQELVVVAVLDATVTASSKSHDILPAQAQDSFTLFYPRGLYNIRRQRQNVPGPSAVRPLIDCCRHNLGEVIHRVHNQNQLGYRTEQTIRTLNQLCYQLPVSLRGKFSNRNRLLRRIASFRVNRLAEVADHANWLIDVTCFCNAAAVNNAPFDTIGDSLRQNGTDIPIQPRRPKIERSEEHTSEL